jgi:hypothetical protein
MEREAWPGTVRNDAADREMNGRSFVDLSYLRVVTQFEI